MAEEPTDPPPRSRDDQAARELDAIATALAHDLRAPLRAIDGFSRILLANHAETIPDQTQHYLALVRDAGTELADLLDDLVDVVEMTRVPLDPREVDPALLAHELIEAVFEPRAEGREVTWSVGALPRCRADQTLLRRLIEELLDNALKFTAPHERARIELLWDEGAGAYAVRDDGIGLDGELPEQAFAIFGRLNGREAFEGTGSGLAIAARIAERHGGRVWGRGTPAGGATVWFTIG
jgi:signal transduction histidine kinase